MSTFRKLVSVNVLVAAALVIGLINNVAIAGMFGLDRHIDAYFAAQTLAGILMWLIVDYLGKNFLPAFARRHRESIESASVLASLLVTQVSIGAAAVAILLIIFAPNIFGLILPGFSSEEIVLVTETFVILAPSIILMVIEIFHGYVWQHSEQYSRVAIARLFVPLTLAVFILGLGPIIGVRALPIGFLCGHLACAAAMSFRVPYKFRLVIGSSDPEFRKILRNSFMLMSTGFFARSRGLIMQYFGSTLGEGAIAALSMAERFCEPVYQRAQIGIREIVFSQSATAVARKDTVKFARLYNLGVTGIFFVVIPIAVWYGVEAGIIVRAVFGRGEFTETMAERVTVALIGYVGSVIFLGVIQMLSNGFYAMDRIRVPVVLMPAGTVIYLGFAAALTPAFNILGLTLALSLMAAVLVIAQMLLFRLFVTEFALSEIFVTLLKYVLISLIAVLTARQARQMLDLDGIIGLLLSATSVIVVYVSMLYIAGDKMLFRIFKEIGLNVKRKDY